MNGRVDLAGTSLAAFRKPFVEIAQKTGERESRTFRQLTFLFPQQSGAVGETKIDVVVLIDLVACRANLHSE